MVMVVFADDSGGFIRTFIEVEKLDMETLKEIEDTYSDKYGKTLTCIFWRRME